MLKKILYNLPRFVVAIIFLQTLFFKFTGAPESVKIFTELGMEPVGRIGIGILELIAAVLLILPKTSWLGGILGAGLMVGAIGAHLTMLGIEVEGDGGSLFIFALLAFTGSLIVVAMSKEKVLSFIGKK